MNNPFKKLRKIIKKPYYYVNKCPYCGSYATGRYVKQHRRTEVEWQIDEALKNGELIRVKPELLGSNCFCLECDRDFSAPVTMKMVPLSQIDKEKVRRHTVDILSERLSDDWHKKSRGLLAPFINFVGKL